MSWCHGPLDQACRSIPSCSAHLVPHSPGCPCPLCFVRREKEAARIAQIQREVDAALHVTSTTYCVLVGDGMKYRAGGTTGVFTGPCPVTEENLEWRIEDSAEMVGRGERTLEDHGEYVWKLLHEPVVHVPDRRVRRERDPHDWEDLVAVLLISLILLAVNAFVTLGVVH